MCKGTLDLCLSHGFVAMLELAVSTAHQSCLVNSFGLGFLGVVFPALYVSATVSLLLCWNER